MIWKYDCAANVAKVMIALKIFWQELTVTTNIPSKMLWFGFDLWSTVAGVAAGGAICRSTSRIAIRFRLQSDSLNRVQAWLDSLFEDTWISYFFLHFKGSLVLSTIIVMWW